MKTIVITGSAGLIGSHLCYKFLELGYIVVGVDNLIGGYASNMLFSSAMGLPRAPGIYNF